MFTNLQENKQTVLLISFLKSIARGQGSQLFDVPRIYTFDDPLSL